MWRFGLFFTVLLCAYSATATEYPRPGSLLRDEVNVRVGPGTDYPILWVYRRSGWPIVLEAEHQRWYRIRDIEGEVGWVSRHLVSKQETALIRGPDAATLFRKASGEKPIIKLAPGVIVRLEKCTETACEVRQNGRKGWIDNHKMQRVKP